MAIIEIKEGLLGLLLIITGIVFIVAPATLSWLIGVVLIVAGVTEFLPRKAKK